jgi:hypothetical protein
MATQHNGKSMGGARTIVDKSVKAEVLVYLKILGIIVALIPVGYFCFFLVFVFAVASPSVKKFDAPDRRFDVKVESYGLFSGDGSEVITLESKSGQAKCITEITGSSPDILWNTNRIVSINFSRSAENSILKPPGYTRDDWWLEFAVIKSTVAA